MAKKTIETPGVFSEELTDAQGQVNNIEVKANNLVDAISLNQAIIDNPNALEDEKEQAQLKINTQQAALDEINTLLGDAKTSLETIKSQAQTQAATAKKTDMTNITINKTETKNITGAYVELTDKGYIIRPRETGVKQ